MREPMRAASDILSPVSIGECETIAAHAEGKVVLEIGSGLGRLTIALASVSQRVHSLDDHGGDCAFGNTVTEFLTNLKRYRVLDRTIMHVGTMDKALLVMDRAIFHVVVFIGDKGIKMLEAMPEWFASGSFSLVIHATKPEHNKAVASFCAKQKKNGKKMGERIYLIEQKGVTDGGAR